MSAYDFAFLIVATLWILLSLILSLWKKPQYVLWYLMWGAVVLEIMAIVGYVRS